MSCNKVQGGTQQHWEHKCATCRNAQTIRGLAISNEVTYCRAFNNPFPIRDRITECSLYDDKRMPSRFDMEQIAWVLVTNKAGKAIGFVSAEDARKANSPMPPQVGF